MTALHQMIRIYSTCRGCRELMQVIDRRPSHPVCPTRLTDREREMNRLLRQWLELAAAEQDTTDLDEQIAALEAQQYPPDLARWAVKYAQMGWLVFPLARCSKIPAISRERGGRGYLDATSDPDRIRRWWAKHPGHNIGLATGQMFDVIDVDPRNGGVPTLLRAAASGAVPDVHGLVTTAQGGIHLYIKARGRRSFKARTAGIDHKAQGGYVVAPPSWLGTPERSYSWSSVPSPEIRRTARKRLAS